MEGLLCMRSTFDTGHKAFECTELYNEEDPSRRLFGLLSPAVVKSCRRHYTYSVHNSG
eukprot:SAG31_NODE_204_length_20414_cov_19.143392_16_plen_58_part_00